MLSIAENTPVHDIMVFKLRCDCFLIGFSSKELENPPNCRFHRDLRLFGNPTFKTHVFKSSQFWLRRTQGINLSLNKLFRLGSLVFARGLGINFYLSLSCIPPVLEFLLFCIVLLPRVFRWVCYTFLFLRVTHSLSMRLYDANVTCVNSFSLGFGYLYRETKILKTARRFMIYKLWISSSARGLFYYFLPTFNLWKENHPLVVCVNFTC